MDNLSPLRGAGFEHIEAVVKGGVHEDGAKVRVHVRAIEPETGRYMWTQIFDRDGIAGQSFALQDDLAQEIAKELIQIQFTDAAKG